MAPRTDLVKQIAARMEELRPAHEEYLTLGKVLDELEGLRPGNGRRAGARGEGRRGPGRPPGRAKASAGRTRRRSRKGGTRAEQALALIKESPGLTVPQIAEQMGIRQNYLYRVTAGLQKDRLVRRRNGGFYAA